MEVKRRYSIKVRSLAKGTKTWECEVDCEGETIEIALSESDKLVKELEERYPVLGTP